LASDEDCQEPAVPEAAPGVGEDNPIEQEATPEVSLDEASFPETPNMTQTTPAMPYHESPADEVLDVDDLEQAVPEQPEGAGDRQEHGGSQAEEKAAKETKEALPESALEEEGYLSV